MAKENLTGIGERIRAVRSALRVQQKEAAAAMDMAPSYLSEIEAGKAKPGPDFFVKLHAVYNVDLNYILLGQGEMFMKETKEITLETFDFDEDVDSVEKMLWLVNNSAYVKNTILGFTSKLILDNEESIKRSIAKKFKKETD